MSVPELRKKFREVLKYSCADLTATQMAHLTHLNINAINRILHLVRQGMFELSQLQTSPLVGQIEVDEKLFWCTENAVVELAGKRSFLSF